jgi:uncharacterized protein (TIGR02452 family)
VNAKSNHFKLLPFADSPEMADACRRALDVSRGFAASLGQSAVIAANRGFYFNAAEEQVDISELVAQAVAAKQSIPPDASLPKRPLEPSHTTQIQVANETTLQAARRLVDLGQRPVALNFANAVNPGGGFLNGARAQEEVLCRSSALFTTLDEDPMYEYHRENDRAGATDWVIYSPDVPVYRRDDGAVIDLPWTVSFLTSAAPYAPAVGQPESGDLLQKRIFRVLEVAHAYGYQSLVLGAWGCGAFRNDPERTAEDFKDALENDFRGCFLEVVFAITDWSPQRRFLGPFRDVFAK